METKDDPAREALRGLVEMAKIVLDCKESDSCATCPSYGKCEDEEANIRSLRQAIKDMEALDDAIAAAEAAVGEEVTNDKR